MQIREAQPADALAIADVHVRAWREAYRDLLPAPFLAQLSPSAMAARYTFASEDPLAPHTLVLLEENEIRGFASTMPSRDPDLPNHGELCALYIDPNHWHRGYGYALMLAARTHLVATGFQQASLWILEGNHLADAFYRRDGWLPDGARKTELRQGTPLHELRYQREL